MTTAQVEFTEDELLQDPVIVEPLFADGRRCHGGFDESGTYRSPRTAVRVPAIDAWEAQRVEQFGTPLLDIPLETWPESFPNIEQSKLLLRHGIDQPTIASLTRIGTVEGFGVLLRQLPVPDFQSCFDEDVTGTAIDHIDRGLFEAHARDEAGFEDQAGHDTMWFAARDIAFERPVTSDQTKAMLARMGIGGNSSSSSKMGRRDERLLPEDIDAGLESVVRRMIGLLLIEISAFHGFRWAEGVLSDDELVAGDGEAARIISYIRADEAPHVAWLRTALSEMRDRTWIGTSGRRYEGHQMIERLWEPAVADSLGVRRDEVLQLTMAEITRAVGDRPDGDDVIEEMLSLGDVLRGADGRLVDAPRPR